MEFDGLRARRSTGHHGCRTYPANVGKELTHRLVGPQPLGRNRHAHLDAVPVRADDLRGAGVRLDEDVNSDA